MRARLALAVSEQQCELREIVLREKPAAMLEASPKGTVPVLVQPDGRVIDESLDIMLWALGHNDPQMWMAPQEGSFDELLALIAECERAFKPSLDRYKYPDRFENADALACRAHCSQWLRKLDDRLHAVRAGRGIPPFLFGMRACLADAAIMPFVRQFAQVDREWFDAQPWHELRQWLDGWLSSALFGAVMAKRATWDGSERVIFP